MHDLLIVVRKSRGCRRAHCGAHRTANARCLLRHLLANPSQVLSAERVHHAIYSLTKFYEKSVALVHVPYKIS